MEKVMQADIQDAVIQDGAGKTKVSASTLKFVLVAVASHIKDGGDTGWPSENRIARFTSKTEKTVRRALIAADQAGWVRHTGYDADYHTKKYTFDLDRLGGGHSDQRSGRPEVTSSKKGGRGIQKGRSGRPTNRRNTEEPRLGVPSAKAAGTPSAYKYDGLDWTDKFMKEELTCPPKADPLFELGSENGDRFQCPENVSLLNRSSASCEKRKCYSLKARPPQRSPARWESPNTPTTVGGKSMAVWVRSKLCG